MTDVLTPEQRRKCMSSVQRKDTSPELVLRSIIHKSGLRYRLHRKNLPGTPDIVFPRFKAVLFVHGCYWHSHGCYKSTVPKSRQEFWKKKFDANKERDVRNVEALLKLGWRVMTVWECALKGKKSLPDSDISDLIKTWLLSSEQVSELPENYNIH